MCMTDPIADMLTRIRNAGHARFDKVDIPASRMKISLARILKEEGFIKNYKVIKDNRQGILRVYLEICRTSETAHPGFEADKQAWTPGLFRPRRTSPRSKPAWGWRWSPPPRGWWPTGRPGSLRWAAKFSAKSGKVRP